MIRLNWLLFPALFPTALQAQMGAGIPPSRPPLISWVEIEQANIFDSAETRSVLNRLANGLHVVTQRQIVARELLFQPGAAYDSAQMAETRRNLRALGIFRSVWIDTVSTDSGLVAKVLVKDGWSTRPDLGFRSSGSEVSYSLELLEDNLLGTATEANIIYRHDPDRTSTSVVARRSRLIANRVNVGAGYAPASNGYSWNVSLVSPFRTLRTRFAAYFDLRFLDQTNARFRDGVIVPGDSVGRRLLELRTSAGWAVRAESKGYLRLGLSAYLQRDRIEETLGPAAEQRTTVSAGPTLEWAAARYQEFRGFQSMDRVEDINLSSALSVGSMFALRAFGHPRDGIAPVVQARTGMPVPGGFLVTSIHASGLFGAGGLDSGSVSAGTTLALRPDRNQLIVVHADGAVLLDPALGVEFDVGLFSGPRGFPTHAFTGDRKLFLTGEYRWTVSPALFNAVAVGLAGFADLGGAWFAGTSPRLGASVGLGLRLDSPREAKGNFFRIDLARALSHDGTPGEWTFVLGKGFVF